MIYLTYGYEAEKWIKEWSEGYGVTYKDMMEAAKEHIKTGEWFSRGGTFEDESVPQEFWDHYESVTGEKVPEDSKENFFSCSC